MIAANSLSIPHPIQADSPQSITAESIISKIGDVLRGTLIAQDLEQIPRLLNKVIELVKKHNGTLYLKNFWADRKHLSLGYVGDHIKIRIPIPRKAGECEQTSLRYLLMELQIHVKEIMDGTEGCAKEIAHRLYKSPEEVGEGITPLDVISCSQLIYLTSMVKLLYPREELEKIKNTLDLVQLITKSNEKMRLVLETALLLGNADICEGEWSERLQAVVPKDKAAVEAAWDSTAEEVNNRLKLPLIKMDVNNGPWTNTAKTVDELFEDAMQMAALFKEICETAVEGEPGCFVNFGPQNRHMIKERSSLQTKIDKDILSEMKIHMPSEAEYKQPESESHPRAPTRTLASFFPRLKQQMLHPISLKQKHPSFIGRQIELQTMAAMINTQKIISLWGPPGIGKTELAITFANEHLEDYSLIWFIACSTEDERLTAYIELASILNLPFHPGQPRKDFFRSLHLKLENKEGKPWLLIYDDVESDQQNPALQYPARGGHIITTSTAKNPYIPSIQINPFSTQEAELLLEQLTKVEKTSPEMRSLIELCGNYPFILERVGMDICRTPGPSIKSRLSTLLKDEELARLPSQLRYSKTFERAMLQTIYNLPPLALKWLQACYYLNHSALPLSYLDRWLKLQKADGVSTQKEIVVALLEHGIQQLEGELLTMQHFLHRSLSLLPQQGADTALLHIQQILAEEAMGWDNLMKTDYPLAIKKALIWSGHALNLLKKPDFNTLSFEKRASIYHFLGIFEEKQSKYDLALTYHQTALELRQYASMQTGIEPSLNPTVANSLTGLGNCYESQGKYNEGLKYYSEACKIYKTVLGTNPHPDIAESLIGMGLCLASLGKYEKALPVYEEALSIFIKYFGENHPDVAKSLNHIGNCHLNQGNLSKALAAYDKAFEICNLIEIGNHPIKAFSLTCQGFCYYAQEKYQDALEAFAQAIEIQKTVFGENHTDIANCLKHIGSCYEIQGDYAGALTVYTAALEIYSVSVENHQRNIEECLRIIELCKKQFIVVSNPNPIHAQEKKTDEAFLPPSGIMQAAAQEYKSQAPEPMPCVSNFEFKGNADDEKRQRMIVKIRHLIKTLGLEEPQTSLACSDSIFSTLWQSVKTMKPPKNEAMLEVLKSAIRALEQINYDILLRAKEKYEGEYDLVQTLLNGVISINEKKGYAKLSDSVRYISEQPGFLVNKMLLEVEPYLLKLQKKHNIPLAQNNASKPSPSLSIFKEFKDEDDYGRRVMILEIQNLIYALGFEKEKLPANKPAAFTSTSQAFFRPPLQTWKKIKVRPGHKNIAMHSVLKSAIRALEEVNYDILHKEKEQYSGRHDVVYSVIKGRISIEADRAYHESIPFRNIDIPRQPATLVDLMLTKVTKYLHALHKKYDIPLVLDKAQMHVAQSCDL